MVSKTPLKQARNKNAIEALTQKAADLRKKDVWVLQAFSQTFLELRVWLGNEGKASKNLNSQTWPGTPKRPSHRRGRSRLNSQPQGAAEFPREFGATMGRPNFADPTPMDPILHSLHSDNGGLSAYPKNHSRPLFRNNLERLKITSG